MTPEKITRNFLRCRDWEERYLYLIELGEKMPSYPYKRSAEQLVNGCQSQVWINIEIDKETNHLRMYAASDATIVQGLLALLHIAYDDIPLESVLQFDISSWFEQLNLISHLTPTRANGLDAIVRHIHAFYQLPR